MLNLLHAGDDEKQPEVESFAICMPCVCNKYILLLLLLSIWMIFSLLEKIIQPA